MLARMTLLAIALGSPAMAAPQCGKRMTVVATLAERYGETLQNSGRAANGVLMETYASDESGTWSITVTTADGTTCLVASGDNWQASPQGEGI